MGARKAAVGAIARSSIASSGILDVSLFVGYVWADEPRSTAAAWSSRALRPIISAGSPRASRSNIGTHAPSLNSVLKPVPWTAASSARWTRRRSPRFWPIPVITQLVAETVIKPRFWNLYYAIKPKTLYSPASPIVTQRRPVTRRSVGARIPVSIGATLDPKASQPVKAEAVVKFLLAETNPVLREAVVQIQGITLVLAAYRRPYHDIQDFRRFRIGPGIPSRLSS